MARKRMVTRTITSTMATFLAANLGTKQVEEITIELTPQLSKDIINKKKDKIVPPDGYKLIECTGVEYKETSYAIPEDKFIEIANSITNSEPTMENESDEEE